MRQTLTDDFWGVIQKYKLRVSFKAYVKDENTNAKNSTTFSNYIRNVPIEDDEIMVLFDVTYLYTNIPIIDRLNIRIMLIMMITLQGKRLYLRTSFLI